MKNALTNPIVHIPCSKEQADTIIEAFNQSDSGWSNYLEDLMAMPQDDPLRLNVIVNRHQVTNLITMTEWSSWGFDVVATEDGVDFRAKENFDINSAANFTQAVLLGLDLDLLVEIAIVGSGTSALEIAQGTIVCMVTKELITTRDLTAFFADEREAFAKGNRYYECSITELNGGIEYPSNFLMLCEKDDDPDERLQQIFLTYRGKGELEGDNFIWYEDCLAAKVRSPARYPIATLR
ncbi:hypothetical protein [Shewanella colwelliana]|uniref:hypothetical protein n=1 Tax=Shewanella colwelliana TaxID=23 RepID=UPI0022AF29C1|nr:hypothetical protein [Shewanella colwelliana]MCZ4337678.1 hypothetical protein [Shewanella colwelliana]